MAEEVAFVFAALTALILLLRVLPFSGGASFSYVLERPLCNMQRIASDKDLLYGVKTSKKLMHSVRALLFEHHIDTG